MKNMEYVFVGFYGYWYMWVATQIIPKWDNYLFLDYDMTTEEIGQLMGGN